MFVTRAYLNRALAEFRRSNNQVVRQNALLVNKARQIVDARNHYLKQRLPFLKDKENYRAKMTRDLRELKRLKATLFNITGRLRLGRIGSDDKPRFLVNLTNVQNHRLKGLLNSDHGRCMRPPEGKLPVHLSPADKQKLSMILKKKLSWRDDVLRFKDA